MNAYQRVARIMDQINHRINDLVLLINQLSDFLYGADEFGQHVSLKMIGQNLF